MKPGEMKQNDGKLHQTNFESASSHEASPHEASPHEASPHEMVLRTFLPVGKSFDVLERIVSIGGKDAYLYFIDGFVKDEVMQRILTDFFKIKAEEMERCTTAEDFSKYKIPYIEVALEPKKEKAATAVLAGQTALVIEGYREIVLMDLRTYPVRGISEPEKEKTLRGARDGFVETIVFNTALIRRRVRDPRLIFSMHSVGSVSKTDVCMGYLSGLADETLVCRLQGHIEKLSLDSLTVGDQSLVEALWSEKEKNMNLQAGEKEGEEAKEQPGWRAVGKWVGSLNPLPKVRYTQRPDVVAAHLAEGKFVVLVDNSPTAMIFPTGLFDFLQDVDDYYVPLITGNYFRMIRNFTLLLTVFLTPLYLLMEEGALVFSPSLSFFLPEPGYHIPIFLQFLLLELAVDGLKLASLNTPNSLGMSLSVIGALILGEFSVTTGWFIPQTILLMAVVALAGFSQASMELNYAIKFMRVGLLTGAFLGGLLGFLGVGLLELLLLFRTKTITGTSYLYPLVPFDAKKLMGLLFRTKKQAFESSKAR